MQQNNRFVQASVQINGVQQYITVDQFDDRQPHQQRGYNGRAGTAPDVFRGKQLTPVNRGAQQSFIPPVQDYSSPAPIPMVKATSRPIPMTNEASRQRQQQPQQYQQQYLQSQVGGKRGSMLAQSQSQHGTRDLDSLYPKRQRQADGVYSHPALQQMGLTARYNHQGPALLAEVEPLPAHLALRDIQHLRCMLANIMQEHLEKEAFPDPKAAALAAAAASPTAAAATPPLVINTGDADNVTEIAAPALGFTDGVLAIEAATPADAPAALITPEFCSANASPTKTTISVQDTDVAMLDTAVDAAADAGTATDASNTTAKLEESMFQGSDESAATAPSHSDAAAAEPCAATAEDLVALAPPTKQEEEDLILLQPAVSAHEAVPSPAADVDMPEAATDVLAADTSAVDTKPAAATSEVETLAVQETMLPAELADDKALDIVSTVIVPTIISSDILNPHLAVTITEPALADTDMAVAQVELAVNPSGLPATGAEIRQMDFARRQAAKAARKLLAPPPAGYAISCVRPEFNRRFHRDLEPRQHGYLRLAEFVAHVAGDMVIFNKDKAIMLLPKPGFDYSKLAKGGAGTPAPPSLLLGAADVKQQGSTAVAAIASSPEAAAMASAKLKEVAAGVVAAVAAPPAATPSAAVISPAPAAAASTGGIPVHLRTAGGPVVPFGTRVMTTLGNETTTGKLIKIAAKIVRRHVLLYRFQMYRSICKEIGNTLRLTAFGPSGSYTKQDVALGIVSAAAASGGGTAAGGPGLAKLSAGAVVAALLHKKREELAEQLGPSFCFEMQDLAAVLIKVGKRKRHHKWA